MKIHPLKLYLLKNKMTQKEFTALSKIPPLTIHRIINYKLKGVPRKDTIDKLHKLTGIPKIEFLYPAEEEK